MKARTEPRAGPGAGRRARREEDGNPFASRRVEPFTRRVRSLVDELDRLGVELAVDEAGGLVVRRPRGVEVPPHVRAGVETSRGDVVAFVRARHACAEAVRREFGFWGAALAGVAHELGSLDRERLRAIEVELADATRRGDRALLDTVLERWIWAAHPLRWLPHGEHAEAGLGLEAVRAMRHTYDAECLSRGVFAAERHRWAYWPKCTGGECRGACRPPGERDVYHVEPGVVAPWAT